MPDSMFDKLGELISEGFESGIFFTRNENPASKNTSKPAEEQKGKYSDSTQKSTKTSLTQDTVYKSVQPNNQNQDCIVSQKSKLIKYAHPDIQKALSFVGVNLSDTAAITYDQAKKLFHKKLMRFHPDKNAKNETMDKITREKTAQILDAWKLIEDWFKSQD
jgi:hypothetical protein